MIPVDPPFGPVLVPFEGLVVFAVSLFVGRVAVIRGVTPAGGSGRRSPASRRG